MPGYGSDSDFQDWLDANGLELPDGAPSLAILRQIGSDYVDGAYEAKLQCSKRAGGFNQERAWPRVGHTVNCEEIPSDLIPQAWINASYRAAYLQAVSGWAQSGTDPNRLTKREKADVLEREFFAAGEGATKSNASAGFPVDPLIDGWVSLWLCATARSIGFLVI